MQTKTDPALICPKCGESIKLTCFEPLDRSEN